jgi:hypothetical protein
MHCSTKLLIGGFAGLAALLLVVAGFAVQRVTPKVYLVPLEAEPQLLQSLRGYYQQELSLDVEILPALQLTRRLSRGASTPPATT